MLGHIDGDLPLLSATFIIDHLTQAVYTNEISDQYQPTQFLISLLIFSSEGPKTM